MLKYFKNNSPTILPIIFILNSFFIVPNISLLEDKLFLSSYALFDHGPQDSFFEITWNDDKRDYFFLKDIMPKLNRSHVKIYSLSHKLRDKKYPDNNDLKILQTFCSCSSLRLLNISSSKAEYFFNIGKTRIETIREYSFD